MHVNNIQAAPEKQSQLKVLVVVGAGQTLNELTATFTNVRKIHCLILQMRKLKQIILNSMIETQSVGHNLVKFRLTKNGSAHKGTCHPNLVT